MGLVGRGGVSLYERMCIFVSIAMHLSSSVTCLSANLCVWMHSTGVWKAVCGCPLRQGPSFFLLSETPCCLHSHPAKLWMSTPKSIRPRLVCGQANNEPSRHFGVLVEKRGWEQNGLFILSVLSWSGACFPFSFPSDPIGFMTLFHVFWIGWGLWALAAGSGYCSKPSSGLGKAQRDVLHVVFSMGLQKSYQFIREIQSVPKRSPFSLWHFSSMPGNGYLHSAQFFWGTMSKGGQ